MPLIEIELGRCGRRTCISEGGLEAGHCNHLINLCRGVMYCEIFHQQLRDENGVRNGPGHLQRLPECLEAERENERI